MANNQRPRVRFRYSILRNGDRISAAVLLIAFLVFLIASIDLENGTLMQPGPGLWPTFLASAGALLSVVLFMVGREIPILAKSGTLRTFCVTLGSMSILPLGYTLVGFIPSAAVCLFSMICLIGAYKWHISAIVAVLGAIAIYVLFAIGLALPIAAL